MSEANKPQGSFPFPWSTSGLEEFQGSLQELQEMTAQAQNAALTWMRRRQEAAETGWRSLQALCACRDPAAWSAAYGDWLSKSTEGALTEIRELQGEMLRYADFGQKLVSTAFQLKQEMAKETQESKADPRKEGAQARSAA